MSSLCVICTFGNALPSQRFASSIRTQEDAETLKRLAISLGYRDAEIWDEGEFRAYLTAKSRSQADKKRAARAAS